jgi:MinD-like ATPase involved in chromosome partitioning or flagellar assembly
MKKIITALGNPVLNNELKRFQKYDVLHEDIIYQEAVLDILEIYNPDVLVLSGLLQGQSDGIEFIDLIRKKNRVARIILITDKINDETKNILISKGIFDIFCDSEIEIGDVLEAIDREEPINKKIEIIEEEVREKYNNNNNISKEKIYISKTQKQEIIAFSGTSGSGKSTILKNLSLVLSNKTTSKILVIDLDTLNGNIDEIYNINKIPQGVDILLDEEKKCGLNYIVDLISKNRFDSNVFDELVVKCQNVDIITGNTSLHYCQNVLNTDYYDKILEYAKEKYDFIFIDTSNNIFLDSTKWAVQKASRLFLVTENNYLCIKKANQLLNIFINLWGVWKNKIQIIINKSNSNGLEIELIQNVLGNIQVIGNIKTDKEKIEEQYENILETIKFIPKRTLINRTIELKKQALDLICNKFNLNNNIQSKSKEVTEC